MLAPFTPFLADEIHRNLAGRRRRRVRRGCPTRSTCATSRMPTSPHLLTPSWKRRWRRCGAPSSSAAPPARKRRVKVRQPLRRAVIVANEAERAAIEAHAELVTAELNVKELDFVTEEAELVSYAVKPNYRALGPRFGKRHAAGRRRGCGARRRRTSRARWPTAARSGSSIDGTDHTLGARRHDPGAAAARRLSRSRPRPATRSLCSWRSTRSCAARASPARSSTPSRSPAKRRASRSPTGSSLASAATQELLAVAREHQAYLDGEVLARSVSYGGAEGRGIKIDGRKLQIALRRA